MPRRSLVLIVCSALVSCLLAAPAGASLIAYEGFDYAAGAPLNGLNGGSGWSNAWSAGNPLAFISTPGLDFSGLETTGGAATATAKPDPPSGPDITFESRTLSSTVGADGTTLYLSVLLRPEPGFGFYGGINLGGLFLGKSGTTSTYGLENSADTASSSVVANAGKTTLLLLRAQFLSGNDVLDLFVNPVAGAPLPLVADASLPPFDFLLTDAIVVNNAGAWTADEIRLGTTVEDVLPGAVPEPASMSLLMSGLAAAALARRRRARQ